MSVNLYVLPSMDGTRTLDPRIAGVIQSMHGVTDWHDSDDCSSFAGCWYRRDGDEFEIEIDERLRAFILYGTCDAALKLAMDITEAYGEPLFLVEGDNPSGALQLTTGMSVNEVRQHMRQPTA